MRGVARAAKWTRWTAVSWASNRELGNRCRSDYELDACPPADWTRGAGVSQVTDREPGAVVGRATDGEPGAGVSGTTNWTCGTGVGQTTNVVPETGVGQATGGEPSNIVSIALAS